MPAILAQDGFELEDCPGADSLPLAGVEVLLDAVDETDGETGGAVMLEKEADGWQWWRPFEKMNAISTIWIRKAH